MMQPTESEHIPFGTLAVYDSATALRRAWHHARDAELECLEYYAPFPLSDLHGPPGMRLSGLCLGWGFFGAALGFGLQAYSTVIDYPLLVGGRPLFSWPSFMLVTFEMAVLFAGLAAFFGMLRLNRLPRLHHPLFNARRFELQSRNRFYLLISADDDRYDREAIHALLEETNALDIEEIAR